MLLMRDFYPPQGSLGDEVSNFPQEFFFLSEILISGTKLTGNWNSVKFPREAGN